LKISPSTLLVTNHWTSCRMLLVVRSEDGKNFIMQSYVIHVLTCKVLDWRERDTTIEI
jgi:hypothetical protein